MSNDLNVVALSHLLYDEQDHIKAAFGVVIANGDSVYFARHLVERYDIGENNLGEHLTGYTSRVSGKSALKMNAVLRWSTEEEVKNASISI